MFAIVGRHPHETAGFGDAATSRRSSAPRRDPRARAIGETGLDYYRDHAPRDDQRRAFEAQLELAARLGLPVVIHTRAAEDDTFALLREHAGALPAVILHCFSAPDRLDECVERGYLCSFAGNVTYPKATDLQEAARERARRAAAGGDRLALPRAAAGARQAERAGQRGAHRATSSPSCAASPTRSSSARSRRTPRGCSAGERASRARRACGACARSASGRTASSARTS